MSKDYKLAGRRNVVAGFIIVIVLIYVVRLFGLQLGDHTYRENADSNAFLKKVLYPMRGLVYDRNGRLVVFNQPAYDLMVTPRETGDFDTVQLCRVLGLTRAEFDEKWAEMKDTRKNPGYSSYTQQKLLSHLSQEDYGRIQEKLSLFPGFDISHRAVRQYSTTAGANVLGNVREVNADDMEKDQYYRAGDYTGDLGIEKSYEKELRGIKGVNIFMKDVHGRIKGPYEHGAHDQKPVSGRTLTLGIDWDLQEYGEQLMRGKSGAIVAIEPSTGEVLALVTGPGYDPSLMLGRDRGKNYAMLSRDPTKPLYNRAIQAAYPPGSTFKPTQGLIFLQEGVITPGTRYPCHHGYVNGLRVGCHSHASPLPLVPAIATSCNAFFCWGFRNMIDKPGTKPYDQLTRWKDYLVSMGYGYRLGIDLPGESRGFIPNADYYDTAFKGSPWRANSVISISIGQGEVLATPLQIANLAATIANRGYYITPHVVKGVQDTVIDAKYRHRHHTRVSSRWYNYIVQGMRQAVLGGTCRTANLPSVEVCGKTGTAQNPHGPDHSVFMGFAPMNNPKIAICVFVETAGFGATFGVPIGSLMMEKYLTGKVERKALEERMMQSATYQTGAAEKKAMQAADAARQAAKGRGAQNAASQKPAKFAATSNPSDAARKHVPAHPATVNQTQTKPRHDKDSTRR